jgi:hypothetical protein
LNEFTAEMAPVPMGSNEDDLNRQVPKIVQINQLPEEAGDEINTRSEHDAALEEGDELPEPEPGPIRRSNRPVHTSTRLRDFVTYSTTHHPIDKYVRYDKVSENL